MRAVSSQLKLMTSWAVVCDVYFLPPQTRGEDETAQQFAERCQVRRSELPATAGCCELLTGLNSPGLQSRLFRSDKADGSSWS